MKKKSFKFTLDFIYSGTIIILTFFIDLLQTFIILSLFVSLSFYIFEKESRYEYTLKKEQKTLFIHHYSGF